MSRGENNKGQLLEGHILIYVVMSYCRDRVATPSNMLSMILGVHTTQTFVASSLKDDHERGKEIQFTPTGETDDSTEPNADITANGNIIKVHL